MSDVDKENIRSALGMVRQGSYVVEYGCPNCRQHAKISFPRGTPAPDVEKCPKCECYGAKKCW